MKYLIKNNSSDYELLDDEVIPPNESRVLDNVNLSTLPSAFTATKIIETKKDERLDPLGDSTSQEDNISEVEDESPAEVPDGVANDSEEVQECENPDDESVYDFLANLSKDDLKKILDAKNDTNCTARSEWKIANYIVSTYPDDTKEDFLSILGE